jgi:hypothetical protein
MNDDQGKENYLVDTTDCLEAVGVFRACKNIFFVISIVCLLLLQACFWIVQTGYVEVADDSSAAKAQEQIKMAAEQVSIDPNKPVKAVVFEEKSSFFELTFGRLALVIRFFNFALIPASVLFCLTMLFILKVSLLGRLGGINHIARALFLSLAFVVFLLPWQRFFPGVFLGAMYTPSELKYACAEAGDYDILATIGHYLRFTGYCLLVLLLLIIAQLRSARWSKAILRRLEVI